MCGLATVGLPSCALRGRTDTTFTPNDPTLLSVMYAGLNSVQPGGMEKSPRDEVVYDA